MRYVVGTKLAIARLAAAVDKLLGLPRAYAPGELRDHGRGPHVDHATLRLERHAEPREHPVWDEAAYPVSPEVRALSGRQASVGGMSVRVEVSGERDLDETWSGGGLAEAVREP